MKVIFSGFWEGFFEKTDANKIDFFIELLYNIKKLVFKDKFNIIK